ncbi:MAG: tellurium resistance protein [Pararhodobacter sp.]
MTETPRPLPEVKPRHFPPPPPLVEKTPGLWRRTPPAIFPPMMGLLGLGLAWRTLAAQPGGLSPVAETILGAVLLLYAFGLVAYLAKPLRRPGVVVEDLAVLPGRAGLAAMVLSLLLAAAAVRPYAPGLALGMTIVGLVALAGLGLLIGVLLLRGPEEGRTVTPVFHLTYVGYILSPLTLIPLGHATLSSVILGVTVVIALAIWLASLRQLATRVPPAPLRLLLAIHLAPASLFATVSALAGYPTLAMGFGLLALAILVALVASGRWLLAAGFSPLWGALTFPLAASATASMLSLGTPGLWIGTVLMIAASALNPYVAKQVLTLWARGQLAAKTNAATV